MFQSRNSGDSHVSIHPLHVYLLSSANHPLQDPSDDHERNEHEEGELQRNEPERQERHQYAEDRAEKPTTTPDMSSKMSKG